MEYFLDYTLGHKLYVYIYTDMYMYIKYKYTITKYLL
jgi:hypothetical protein